MNPPQGNAEGDDDPEPGRVGDHRETQEVEVDSIALCLPQTAHISKVFEPRKSEPMVR